MDWLHSDLLATDCGSVFVFEGAERVTTIIFQNVTLHVANAQDDVKATGYWIWVTFASEERKSSKKFCDLRDVG